jgi:hypothetical protein
MFLWKFDSNLVVLGELSKDLECTKFSGTFWRWYEVSFKMFLVSLVLDVSVDHTIFETTINRGASSLLYKQASKLTSDSRASLKCVLALLCN